jgi:cbb3-type cytochrome oxidase maturation protein
VENSLYILIPLSLVLVFVIAALFWWSVRSGQYDDLEGPAYRLLFDDNDATKNDDVARSKEARRSNAPGGRQ